MKILVIDDDEVSRTVLATMIERLPDAVEVVQAEDGEQAWQLLSSESPPDLCCCDLHMPGLDGVGLLQRARADSLLTELPFVMISSAADRASVTAAIQSGANDFIVKPFSAATVSRAIEKALKEARARDVESLGEVRRRLSMSQQEVLNLVQRLCDDLESLGESDDLMTEHGAALLKRLQSASVLLGMHRVGRILKRSIEAQDDRRQALVAEAARFTRKWLSDTQAQLANH